MTLRSSLPPQCQVPSAQCQSQCQCQPNRDLSVFLPSKFHVASSSRPCLTNFNASSSELPSSDNRDALGTDKRHLRRQNLPSSQLGSPSPSLSLLGSAFRRHLACLLTPTTGEVGLTTRSSPSADPSSANALRSAALRFVGPSCRHKRPSHLQPLPSIHHQPVSSPRSYPTFLQHCQSFFVLLLVASAISNRLRWAQALRCRPNRIQLHRIAVITFFPAHPTVHFLPNNTQPPYTTGTGLGIACQSIAHHPLTKQHPRAD